MYAEKYWSKLISLQEFKLNCSLFLKMLNNNKVWQYSYEGTCIDEKHLHYILRLAIVLQKKYKKFRNIIHNFPWPCGYFLLMNLPPPPPARPPFPQLSLKNELGSCALYMYMWTICFSYMLSIVLTFKYK